MQLLCFCIWVHLSSSWIKLQEIIHGSIEYGHSCLLDLQCICYFIKCIVIMLLFLPGRSLCLALSVFGGSDWLITFVEREDTHLQERTIDGPTLGKTILKFWYNSSISSSLRIINFIWYIGSQPQYTNLQTLVLVF